MIRDTFKRLYACILLLILMSAAVGQKVHIYMEDPLHFAAFSGDLIPDSGARSQIVERCLVDDFCFFPCLNPIVPPPVFYSEMLSTLLPGATCCKQASAVAGVSLRAPPVV